MNCAGIVLYKPNIVRLKENLDSITEQVDIIYIYINGYDKKNSLFELLNCYNNINIINPNNNINFGVAKALNDICDVAYKNGFKWILTLDQDSVCNKELVTNYNKYIDIDTQIASLTCYIKDRNFIYEDNDSILEKEVSFCITSGNYLNLHVWKKQGGFDEKLFIDKVDTDYCFRLISNNYKILKIPYIGFTHEIGNNTRQIHILCKKIVIFNHSDFRVYYIIRNQIYFDRKHKKKLGFLKSVRYHRTAWTRVFIYLLFENSKKNKLIAWYRGIRDGYKIKLN